LSESDEDIREVSPEVIPEIIPEAYVSLQNTAINGID
jgi:hypothetical protein